MKIVHVQKDPGEAAKEYSLHGMTNLSSQVEDDFKELIGDTEIEAMVIVHPNIVLLMGCNQETHAANLQWPGSAINGTVIVAKFNHNEEYESLTHAECMTVIAKLQEFSI